VNVLSKVITQKVLDSLGIGVKDELLKDFGCDKEVSVVLSGFRSLFGHVSIQSWKVVNKTTYFHAALKWLRLIPLYSYVFANNEELFDIVPLPLLSKSLRKRNICLI